MKKHSSWQRNQVGPDTLYGCLEYTSQPNNDLEADRLDIDNLAMTANDYKERIQRLSWRRIRRQEAGCIQKKIKKKIKFQ